MTMILQLPWTLAAEDHLGSPAYSIVQSDGLRVAVGFTREDANLVCRAVNALARTLDLVTIYDWFEIATRDHYRDLHLLPEREVTEEVYHHFLGILPPRYLTGGGFAVPEAVTGDGGGVVYSCFEQRGASFYHRYRVLAS